LLVAVAVQLQTAAVVVQVVIGHLLVEKTLVVAHLLKLL
jgi:hypothetical protein